MTAPGGFARLGTLWSTEGGSRPGQAGEMGEDRLESVAVGAVAHEHDAEVSLWVDAHDVPEPGASAEVFKVWLVVAGRLPKPADGVGERSAGGHDLSHGPGGFRGQD